MSTWKEYYEISIKLNRTKIGIFYYTLLHKSWSWLSLAMHTINSFLLTSYVTDKFKKLNYQDYGRYV